MARRRGDGGAQTEPLHKTTPNHTPEVRGSHGNGWSPVRRVRRPVHRRQTPLKPCLPLAKKFKLDSHLK